jgi:riboflavin synthase
MFTGIVQGVASIAQIQDQTGLRTLKIQFPNDFCRDLSIGASIAIDGVCLTVTEFDDDDGASFDVMQQSLNLTTLGSLQVGSTVNAERAAKEGAEIGGHPLSGHVDFTAQLAQVRQLENNVVLRFSVPQSFMRYIFAKGYIAINGASLTIAEVNREQSWFEVWLIPETLRMTVFAQKQVGDLLNIEIERATQVLVDSVRIVMQETLGPLLPALEQLLQQQGKSIDDLAGNLPTSKE